MDGNQEVWLNWFPSPDGELVGKVLSSPRLPVKGWLVFPSPDGELVGKAAKPKQEKSPHISVSVP